MVAVAALVVSSLGAAQTDAPGEPVTIPGVNISGWGQVDQVPGRFARPTGSKPKVPAVLILHGAFGVDGRGAFYAKALNDVGIATLEITMFPPSSPPRGGVKATMPHAAAALKWLAAQPAVDGQRLGIMGFSWGGIMSVLMSSELVQERLGKDVPRPVAFAPFYPCCSLLARMLVNPKLAFYNAHTRMSGSPMLIQVGTRDDYEEGEHTCDALVAMWPAARACAHERALCRGCNPRLRFAEAGEVLRQVRARRAWRDGQRGPKLQGCSSARQAVVNFFVKHLNP